MLAMSTFTEFIVVLCLTDIATGTMFNVNQTIEGRGCVGGQVGLTNTSILVHYRLYEDTSPVGEWTFLREVNTSDSSLTEISTNISATGVQLRFLQLEHGGEGCNCWEVANLDIAVITEQQQLSIDVNCHLNGQNKPRRFCAGSASEARGGTTPVVYFNADTRCPENSSAYLIAPKGKPLPENCSTTNPRM